MSQSLFRGSGVALVTPMTPDGIDFPALEQLIEWHIASGTDALILCATTGEGATLTYAERAEIIERSVRQVNGRVPVIVGTGSNNTASAIALSREACAAGADGVLVVTPYYNKATQRGLVRHFTAVADGVPADAPAERGNCSKSGSRRAAESPAAHKNDGATTPPSPYRDTAGATRRVFPAASVRSAPAGGRSKNRLFSSCFFPHQLSVMPV